MRLIVTSLAAVLFATLLTIASPAPACASASCGMEPMKPMVPMGCKDLVARCTCDAQGKNCVWTWVCVK